MNPSTSLLEMEAGEKYEVFTLEEVASNEKPHSDEIVIITGKITVSP